MIRKKQHSQAISRTRAPGKGGRRFKRRQWAARFMRFVFIFSLLASLSYAFTYYVIDSPRFHVKRLVVKGMVVLSEEEIRQQAGITTDDNLLLFDSGRVQERIESIPYIESCEIQRAYPDTIIIHVKERIPVATVMVHSHAYEVDAQAIVLQEVDPLAPHVGPLVTCVPGLEGVELGARLEQAEFRAALAVWRAFLQVGVSRELTVAEMMARATDDIAVVYDELPFELRWSGEDPLGQAQRLDVLWQKEGGNLSCEQCLDLRFGNHLVCQ